MPVLLHAQSSELGLLLGVASYKGEINTHLFNPDAFNPAAGLYYKRCLNSFWSFRLGVTYGRISGSDARQDEGFNQYRNLSFRSDVWDASALLNSTFSFSNCCRTFVQSGALSGNRNHFFSS